MKHKRFFILLAILALVITSLACSLFSGRENAVSEGVTSQQPAEVVPTESLGDSVLEEDAEKPNSSSRTDIEDEFRSAEGGYAFKPIPDFTFEDFFGLVNMEAPDADPDLGPLIFMIGGTNEEEKTAENIYNDFVTEIPENEINILNQQNIFVDGIEGMQVDIEGLQDGMEVVGRIIIVAVTPTQQFTMFASAPKDRWNELEPRFETVLASVYFFEPQELSPLEEFENEVSEELVPIADGVLFSQWGVLAEASSEHGNDHWSANQATGEPNTPECGDHITAWYSLSSSGVDWIEIFYEVPVIPTEINIFQTENPDQVVKVTVLDGNNMIHTVYQSTPTDRSYDDCPYILTIPVESNIVGVTKIKIFVDQSESEKWNAIDAVELVGYTGTGENADHSPSVSVPPIGEFPNDASDLPPGGFSFLVAHDQGMPTMVTQGSIQNQSTNAEYVIALVSEDQQNILTLIFPMDAAAGILTMNYFNDTSQINAPGATVYDGFTLYTNTDGIIMVDTITDQNMTGSVYFTAIDEDGNEIAVTGFFNQLPLAVP